MTPEEQKNVEILQRLTRIETLLEGMGTAGATAVEAHSLASEAIRRLDKVDKIIFWAGTTVIGAVILGLVTLLIKQGGAS
jgi:hypothetical protein